MAGPVRVNPMGAVEAEAAARRIAHGHAYPKHVVVQAEYPAVANPDQFAALLKDVMTNPDATRTLGRGRSAYWRDKVQTLVVIDPKHPDGGTAFRPPDGKRYFDRLA